MSIGKVLYGGGLRDGSGMVVIGGSCVVLGYLALT